MSPFAVGNSPPRDGGGGHVIAGSRKAIVAAGLAFLAPIGAVLTATDQPLDWRTFAAAAVSGVITGGGVWLTANAQPTAPPAE